MDSLGGSINFWEEVVLEEWANENIQVTSALVSSQSDKTSVDNCENDVTVSDLLFNEYDHKNCDSSDEDNYATPPATLDSDDHYSDDSGLNDEASKSSNSCRRESSRSLVDQLLTQIHLKLREYDRRSSRCSESSSLSPCDFTYRKPHIRRTNLLAKDITELNLLLKTLEYDIKRMNTALLHHLKRKDRLFYHQEQLCDMITAYLQAISPKRSVDTKMRFSIEPVPNKCSGFHQWHDAMRMVARLPGGIPNEFRKKLWITLAQRHVEDRKIVWTETTKFCFNEKCNPEDDSLGTQIVKDLHRTGCSLFSGENCEHNQALLKQVLLAYARWNRQVGYCQGFNMLAAIILEVMDWDVQDSLKVMIYLIEGVLPTSYFANNLRGLSVDMAAFRDLLRLRLPDLARHLERLERQNDVQEYATVACYEPPLINVFTMQWFLTLFSNCLPKPLVLRIWDLIFLEGNEILIRTALAIWDCLQDRVITVQSADEFYSIMGVLTRELMEFGIHDANQLIKTICTMAPFPFPQLSEFREKYTFNIRPLTSLVKKGVNLFCSDEEDEDSSDPVMVASWCLSNAFNGDRSKDARNGNRSASSSPLDNIGNSISSSISNPGNFLSSNNIDPQRMTLDISMLKKQYMKLKERQRQAHIIIEGLQNAKSNANARSQSLAMNHLLQGKTALIAKRAWKPCPVRQPTIGVSKFPPNKQPLSQRSRTVANLIPSQVGIAKETKEINVNDLKRHEDAIHEPNNNQILRKFSEPNFNASTAIVKGEDNSDTEVAFLQHPNKCKLEPNDKKGHDSSDTELSSDELDTHSSSSSTELCDSDPESSDSTSLVLAKLESKLTDNDLSSTSKNHEEKENLEKSSKSAPKEANYDQIKRELIDLSVEQCIRKLNEKMSSLSTCE